MYLRYRYDKSGRPVEDVRTLCVTPELQALINELCCPLTRDLSGKQGAPALPSDAPRLR